MSLTIATFVALSLACAAPKDDEEEEETVFGDADTDADGDTDTDADVAFAFGGDDGGVTTDGVSGSCDGGTCTYRITTTAPAGELGLWIAETNAPEGAEWTEQHSGFDVETMNDDGSETYRLDLEWIYDYTDFVEDETTLLNPEVISMDGITWLFFAVSESGSENDCLVTGDNPSYYASECTQVGR